VMLFSPKFIVFPKKTKSYRPLNCWYNETFCPKIEQTEHRNIPKNRKENFNFTSNSNLDV